MQLTINLITDYSIDYSDDKSINWTKMSPSTDFLFNHLIFLDAILQIP